MAAATHNQGSIRSRRSIPGSPTLGSVGPEKAGISVMAGNNMMQSPELQIMTPLLRFMQLLCENHNTILQVGVESCLFVCLFVYLFICFSLWL